VGAQRDVPSEYLEELPLRDLQGGEEGGADEPGEAPHQRRVQERAPEDAQLEWPRAPDEEGEAVEERAPGAAWGRHAGAATIRERPTGGRAAGGARGDAGSGAEPRARR